MNYAYNGRGEQVRKHLGTSNTYTLYDEGGHWLGDYDHTGAPLQQAIWMDDLPVGLLANGNQLHYIQPDHLGTPRVVIEVVRDVPVWEWDAKGEAFGNTAPDQDPDGDANLFVLDMRFPGQRFDLASGLNYNGNRDYDSATGRYPQSDPLGLRGGINTYGYAYSSSLMWVDPDGLQAMPIPMGPGMTGAAGAAGAYNPNNPNDPNNLGDFGPKISIEDVALASQLALGLMNMINPDSALRQLTGTLIQEACRDDDDSERCEREWREARRLCRQLIFEQMQQAAGRRKKRSVTGVTGGFTDVELCARGLVSEHCGGNKVKK